MDRLSGIVLSQDAEHCQFSSFNRELVANSYSCQSINETATGSTTQYRHYEMKEPADKSRGRTTSQ